MEVTISVALSDVYKLRLFEAIVENNGDHEEIELFRNRIVGNAIMIVQLVTVFLPRRPVPHSGDLRRNMASQSLPRAFPLCTHWL